MAQNLRDRLDPVAQARPFFTTMADSAPKTALLPREMAQTCPHLYDAW